VRGVVKKDEEAVRFPCVFFFLSIDVPTPYGRSVLRSQAFLS
jgi:hypothetical protein